MLQPGVVLSDRYEIIQKIGSGGMSIVYKAKCNKLERFVAVKVLRDEFCMDDEFVRKFKVEAQSAASLSHHNIVNIYDVGSDKKIYYIVMEYLEGVTLKEYIKRHAPLSDKETIKITASIASALEHAHTNHIIHRDIKPQNIILTKDGIAKVADFGIARVSTGSTIVANTNVSGSVHYISPEQARGSYSDEKSDLYSLGITMYEMATGTLPYQAESPVSVALQHINQELPSPSEKNPDICKSLESIIIKATLKKSEYRYNSAGEFLKDLKKAGDFPEEDFVSIKDIDNAPTLFMSNGDMQKIWDESETNEDETTSNPLEKVVMVLGVISAIILVAFISYFAINSMKDKLVPNEIAIPNVEGMVLDEAKALLEENGLMPTVIEFKYSSDFELNYIIEQTPSEDSMVEENTVVNLVVSKGIETFSVPDVINLQFKTAQKFIIDANLTYNTKSEFNDTVPTGVIMRQYPEPGKELEKGSEITIVASKGKEDKKVIVPNVENLSEVEASIKLKESGLAEGNITYTTHDEVEKGYVIYQIVKAGEEVIEGYVVDLVVSEGKNAVTKIITVTDVLDFDKSSGQVKVVLINNGEEKVVYDQSVGHEDFPLKISVEGKGQGTVKVYLDGNDEYNQSIKFDEVAN